MSTHDNRDALERLRADLAALRASTTAEFGPFEPSVRPRNGTAVQDLPPPADETAGQAGDTGPDDGAGQRQGVDEVRPPQPVEPDGGPVVTYRTAAAREVAASTRPGPRLPRPELNRRAARPPRPPRRPFAPRAKRPPKRLAVPTPIPVARRPDWLAGPRWPRWDLVSGTTAAVIGLLAVASLAHRLLQAMLDTSVLLGAAPTRTDHLHAAAGVAGGGVTLALAVAALGVVKARTGYLVAAGAVLLAFGAFPAIAYTANAGIVSAPLPDMATMIRPPRWDRQGLMVLAFTAALGALAAALVDLAIRSAEALGTLRRRR